MGFADLLDQVSTLSRWCHACPGGTCDTTAMCTIQVGGFGRYQWIHVTLISFPGLFMASQNLLNNFVSGSPAHHCSLPTNYSLPPNHNLSIEVPGLNAMYDHLKSYMLNFLFTGLQCDWLLQMDPKHFLRAFIPMDSSGAKLDRCRRLRIIDISYQCCLMVLDSLTPLLTQLL